MAESTIKLTKIAVVQREINAAIKMHFLGIDELAVHCVAGSSIKLLQELHRLRGRDPIRKALHSGIVGILHAYLNGFETHHELKSVLDSICNSISEEHRSILKSPNYVSVDLVDLELDDVVLKLWTKILKPVNFLKHASRDSEKLLDTKDVDNEMLLASCCAAYVELGLPMTPEMRIFHCYYVYRTTDSTSDHTLEIPEVRFLVEQLRRVEINNAKLACLKFIEIERDDWEE